MVELSEQYNFSSVIDEFTALKSFPQPHGDFLRERMRSRAFDILTRPDIRYMPAFKLLDLLAEMVNTAADIAAAPQLRRNEAQAMLDAHISDTAPLIVDFMLEAALERARYEPIMLEADDADALAYRNLLLSKRWQAMLTAHQAHAPLPQDWTQTVGDAVISVISAQAFADYRIGPLLQFFAEMLGIARQLHDSAAPLAQLRSHIDEQSPLWKRYALKNARFRDLPSTTQSRMPPIPLPTKHSLH